MKLETAALLVSLTNGREVFTIKEVDGESHLTWDLTDEEMSKLVLLEFGPDQDIDEKMVELVNEVLHATLDYARNNTKL